MPDNPIPTPFWLSLILSVPSIVNLTTPEEESESIIKIFVFFIILESQETEKLHVIYVSL